jgi:hypothetical protein
MAKYYVLVNSDTCKITLVTDILQDIRDAAGVWKHDIVYEVTDETLVIDIRMIEGCTDIIDLLRQKEYVFYSVRRIPDPITEAREILSRYKKP